MLLRGTFWLLLVAMVNSKRHNTCFSLHIGFLLKTGPGTHEGGESVDDGEYPILHSLDNSM